VHPKRGKIRNTAPSSRLEPSWDGAELKGSQDTFLTLIKMVIALRDNVNVFMTLLSGSERRLADGSKKRQKSIAPGGSAERTIDWRHRVVACSVGCDLGCFCLIDLGCVSIAVVLLSRLYIAPIRISIDA
jgi:hypothetical protein